MATVAADHLGAIEQALNALVRGPNSARAHQRISRVLGVDLDRAGFLLLRRVAEEGSVRLSELAPRMGLDLSTVSRQAQQLERKELVVRERDPSDGRACTFTVSPAGRRVLGRFQEARLEILSSVLEGWTEKERAQFARLFERFVDDVISGWTDE